MKRRILCIVLAMLMLNIPGAVIGVSADAGTAADELIFKTNFDGYQIGSGEWTEWPLTSGDMYSEYIYIPDIMDGVKLDDAHGTSLHMSGEGWQQAPVLIKDAANYDKVLFSFDFNVKAASELGVFNVFATDHAEIIDVWVKQDGAIFINNVQYTQENAFTENQWVKMDIFVDYTNSKYIVYVNGNPIGTENVLNMGEVDKISGFNMQSFGGASEAYVDNVEIKSVTTPPYLPDFTAELDSEEIVDGGESLTVSFSAAIDAATVIPQEISLADSSNNTINVTVTQIGEKSITLALGEPIAEGVRYTLSLGGIRSEHGQRLVTNEIPFKVNSAENDELIFSTDFDGYRIGNGEYVNSVYDNSSSEYAEGKIIKADGNHPESSYGVKVDEATRGTSLMFNGNDCDGWPSVLLNFTPALNDGKVLLSYDFLMNTPGWIGIFELDSNNNVQFNATGGEPIVSHGESEYRNAFKVEEWAKIELYMDFVSKEYILYIDGNEIYTESNFSVADGGMNQILFQRYGAGDMYMDNLEVKKVSRPPHLSDLTAQINPSDVGAGSRSITVNFSAPIKRSSVTADNISLYDEINDKEIGVTIDSVDRRSFTVVLDETLKEGGEYLLSLSGVKGEFNQNIANAVIPISISGTQQSDNELVFYTDFDGYQIGNSNRVDDTFNNLSSSYMNGMITQNANGQFIRGERVDSAYGTSMKFSMEETGVDGAWRNLRVGLPDQTGRYLISFALRLIQSGSIRVGTNEFTGAAVTFMDRSAKPETGSALTYTKNVMKAGEWANAEIYLDTETRKYALYIDGRQIDSEQPFAGDAKTLNSIQIQCMTGDGYYLDNFKLEKVVAPPHQAAVMPSVDLENNTIPAGERSFYLNFSDFVESSQISTQNITAQEVIGDQIKTVPISLSEILHKSVKITFLGELNEDATYRICFSEDMHGTSGNKMGKPHICVYPATDKTRVNNVEFASYLGDVYDTEVIPPEIRYLSVYLNKPVSAEGINGNVRLLDENNTEVPAKLRYNSAKNSVRIVPDDMLAGNKQYTVSVSDGILDKAFSKTYTTKEGRFAKGSITIDGAETAHKGVFLKGDTVTVKADVINTACENKDYCVMVGEYANGKLSAYHFYDESITSSDTYQSNEYTVTLKSDVDEIKGFIWQNPAIAHTMNGIAEQTNVSSYTDAVYYDFSEKGFARNLSIVYPTTEQERAVKNGREGVYIEAGGKMIFDIDDAVMRENTDASIEITVEYFDENYGGFGVVYNDDKARTDLVRIEGSNEWRSATLLINDLNKSSTYDGGDFVISLDNWYYGTMKHPVLIGRVNVKVLPPKNVSISVGTIRTGNAYANGEELAFDIGLKSLLPVRREATVRYTVTNYETGEEIWTNTEDIALSGGESINRRVVVPPHKFGRFLLTTEVMDISGVYASKVNTRYSYTAYDPKTMPANEAAGSCVHFPVEDRDSSVVAPLMALTGMKYIRDEIWWHNYEKSPGVYRITDRDSAYLRDVENAGLDKLIILGFSNSVRMPGRPDKSALDAPQTKEELQAWEDYCYNLAKDLGDRCNLYEVWNEPNPIESESIHKWYPEMVKAAYTGVKRANPNAKVIGGAFAGVYLDWNSEVFKEAIDYMDGVSFHLYTDRDTMDNNGSFFYINTSNFINNLKRYKPDMDVYLTEYGWSTAWDGQTQYTIKDNYLKAMTVYNQYPEIKKLFWYEFQNGGTWMHDREMNFGVTENWGRANPYVALPTYCAMAAYNSIIGDKKVCDKYEKDNTYIFRYNKNWRNNDTMMLWQENGTKTVSINLGCESVTMYDSYGNPTTVTGTDGVFSFDLKDEPIMVEGSFADFEVIQ